MRFFGRLPLEETSERHLLLHFAESLLKILPRRRKMKNKILFVIFIFIVQISCAQIPELSFWNNIRNSSYTIEDSIYIRCETIDFPGIQNSLFYSTSDGWQEAEMEHFAGLTYQAVIPALTSETQYCRFKTEHDTLVGMMPAYIPDDVFPPANSALSLVADDPVGDITIANMDHLDITAEYFAYSDSRFYTAIKNNEGAFPPNNGGLFPTEFYIYVAGIINPENVLIDSVAYFLVYTELLLIYPGLYKIVGTELNLNSFQRIGDIEYSISDSTLIMACDIDVLTSDEHFGDWPNITNTLGFDVITLFIDLSFEFQLVDFAKPSIQNIDQYVIEPFVNIVPELFDINANIIGLNTEIDLNYFDENSHFPIISELVVDNNNIYQMFPLSFDYTSTVPFIASIPEIGWDEILIRFSDNGFDFVEETIYNVNADNYELPITNYELRNYPNPFNPETTISFTTENTESTEIIIYNLKGQKIRQYSIFNNQYSIVWDGTDENNLPVGSGIYLYKLKFDDKTVTAKKMLLLK